MKTRLILCGLLLGIALVLDAQQANNSGTVVRASELYDRLGYRAAADLYQRSTMGSVPSGIVMAKLANSYRMNSLTEDAEYWYARIAGTTKEAEHLLRYAQMLQSNGKCQEAIRWYREYEKLAGNQPGKRDFLNSCDELQQFPEHPEITLMPINLNTRHQEFCAMPYRKGIIFTSTRGRFSIVRRSDRWTNDNFTDLFYAVQDSFGHFKRPAPLSGDVNSRYNDGVVALNKTGDRMIFSRNNRRGKNSKGVVDLKLYSAELQNGRWTNVAELPINNNEYTTCHPTLSSDGRWLCFASNRPGGFGGMDIYVSQNIGGYWQAPVNLGPEVNSAGNELFPFLSADGTLYFSSEGHKGLGGLDVFMVTQSDPLRGNSWVKRKNLGRPFNSEKDDFGYVIAPDGKSGFISSNRLNGAGSDDLYTWQLTGKHETPATPIVAVSVKGNVVVVDAATRQPLPGASVSVAMNNQPPALILLTNNDGKASLYPETEQDYQLRATATGFTPKTASLKGKGLLPEYVIALEKEPLRKVNIAIRTKNRNTQQPLTGTVIRLKSTCPAYDNTEYATDDKGRLELPLTCGCDINLSAQKSGYQTTYAKVTTSEADCEKNASIPLDIPLEFLKDSPEGVKAYLLGDEKAVPKAGQVIRLNNIYYDYNRHNIRPDAAKELDYVVQMMKLYPTMKIELGSHTDARGTDSYNLSLSQQRAESAVQYIISRGVASNRLIAKGYGETQPVNRCRNGAKCSEAGHQANRRTEVKVLEINEPGVSVEKH